MDKKVLVVISSARSNESTGKFGGLFATSFIHTFQILQQARFQIIVSTPGGSLPELRCEDDGAARWVREHKQVFTGAVALETVQGSDFHCLAIPNALGALSDLAKSESLGTIIRHMVANKKPIAAVGYGVAGLFSALDSTSSQQWPFRDYSLTGLSNVEVSRTPFFGKLPLMVQDMSLDNGALYQCSVPDSSHVIMDRTLVTGQNTASTIMTMRSLEISSYRKLNVNKSPAEWANIVAYWTEEIFPSDHGIYAMRETLLELRYHID